MIEGFSSLFLNVESKSFQKISCNIRYQRQLLIYQEAIHGCHSIRGKNKFFAPGILSFRPHHIFCPNNLIFRLADGTVKSDDKTRDRLIQSYTKQHNKSGPKFNQTYFYGPPYHTTKGT